MATVSVVSKFHTADRYTVSLLAEAIASVHSRLFEIKLLQKKDGEQYIFISLVFVDRKKGS